MYASSQQANLTFEQDLGDGFALSLAYNFNGGRHLNRPINANASRGDLLVANLRAAVAGGQNLPTDNPLLVSGCGVGAGGPYVPAALVNFFRPSGLNPSIANFYIANGGAACVGLAEQVLQAEGLNANCNPATLSNCVPFGDMDANFSNGSSAYNGFTSNLRKRFSNHYEFLASYTWSHAIDDSTDLQSPLAPQDSYYPNLERSNSAFDQRHRFVFSGVYQSGKLGGDELREKVLQQLDRGPHHRVLVGTSVPDHHRRRRQFSAGQQFGPPQRGQRERSALRLWHSNRGFPVFTDRISRGAVLCPLCHSRRADPDPAGSRWEPRTQRRRFTLDRLQ